MMLRVQCERMSAAGGGFFPSPDEYSQAYGLNLVCRAAMPEHAIVMHPGPMNRGLEITAEAADDPRSRVIEQVGNGVSVRMAALSARCCRSRSPAGTWACCRCRCWRTFRITGTTSRCPGGPRRVSAAGRGQRASAAIPPFASMPRTWMRWKIWPRPSAPRA